MFSNDDIVPVVMFHSIGLEKSDWAFSHISLPLEKFEEKIATLVSSKYHFLFWKGLYDHMAGLRQAPRRSIMLTFDDGYLDNWVYVFPILQKYGAKGTIFVNPEFVPRDNRVRQTLNDVWANKLKEKELQDLGFINWEEMRIMEKSGLVDIQSHALTHTWFFSGPKLLDFYKPGDIQYPWLAWNSIPEQKPYYMLTDQSRFIPWGTPIYEYEKALICRRYFPAAEIAEEIVLRVKEKGGPNFFQQKSWKEHLSKFHDELIQKYQNKEVYESKVEYQKRIFSELTISKHAIENELDKKVDFICWPGGGYNRTVLEIAKHVGYKAWTLSSKDQRSFRNRPGSNPTQIKRIGCFAKYNIKGGKELDYAGGSYFLLGINRHKGSSFHKWLSRFLLIYAAIKYYLKERR